MPDELLVKGFKPSLKEALSRVEHAYSKILIHAKDNQIKEFDEAARSYMAGILPIEETTIDERNNAIEQFVTSLKSYEQYFKGVSKEQMALNFVDEVYINGGIRAVALLKRYSPNKLKQYLKSNLNELKPNERLIVRVEDIFTSKKYAKLDF